MNLVRGACQLLFLKDEFVPGIGKVLMDKLQALTNHVISYEVGSPKRIQHLLKVHAFAKLIGQNEELDDQTLFILETAALVHDIGIKPALEKYGSSAGPLQEKEGVEPTRAMLTELGFDSDIIDRVAYLVGHHHTYDNVEGIDYRILLEADALVNFYEDGCSEAEIRSVLKSVFRTPSGIEICRTMFGLASDEESLRLNGEPKGFSEFGAMKGWGLAGIS